MTEQEYANMRGENFERNQHNGKLLIFLIFNNSLIQKFCWIFRNNVSLKKLIENFTIKTISWIFKVRSFLKKKFVNMILDNKRDLRAENSKNVFLHFLQLKTAIFHVVPNIRTAEYCFLHAGMRKRTLDANLTRMRKRTLKAISVRWENWPWRQNW